MTETTSDQGHTVYYACKYTPLELLYGFGASACLLESTADEFPVADRLSHPNLCGYGRGLIERAMAGDVREIVLVTCCDVVKRVYDVLAAQDTVDFLWLLDLPHRRGPAEVRLFRGRLSELAHAYAAYSHATFDPGRALASLGSTPERIDPRVTLLGAHANASLLDAVAKGVGPDFSIENATCTNRQITAVPPPELARAPRTSSCSACSPSGENACSTDAADAASADGMHPADSAGTRPAGASSSLDAFLDWYAPALLNQIPCMRMDDVRAREELVGKPGQLGIVYHTMKFCDYYGFEYAQLLSDTGEDLPMVKIETDATSQSSGQLLTRLQAFGETLRAAGKGGSDTRAEATEASKTTGAAGANGANTEVGGAATANGSDGTDKADKKTAGTEDRDGAASGTKIGDGVAAGASDGAGAANGTGTNRAPQIESSLPQRESAASIYVLGIDSGSTSTDAALVDGSGRIIASTIVPTGAKATLAAERARDSVLASAGIKPEQVSYTVATGYGRDAISFASATVTEITCHARGAHALDPRARTVIDIGGQDSKVILLSEAGSVTNFVMNDKCAAGTGRFLEMMARTLEVSLDEFCRLGRGWKHNVTISSMCTVFAESEVVSLVAQDTPTPDIIHGLDRSVASKTASLASRIGSKPPYLMTGGVAANEGVVEALSEALGSPVATHPDSQLCGAIGAALIGLERIGDA